ncbi:LysR substrate-binding domain-containing protein [Pseudomonas sp. NPDC089401]|uniref:LysR substrate-binding domain-containing protein n=1 Tax=Pseudomonas sp. NPDC089401 TaxID=3364462 RepID=UPI00382C99A9
MLINRSSSGQAPSRLPHLSLLLAFKTVAELASFTRAAEALHLSQSAVSQQVVKLEEALGVQLFIRSTRSVKMTQEGADLLDDIRGAFEHLVGAFDRCARKAATPTLHIESEPVLSAFWLTPRLRQFTDRFASLHIQQTLTTQRVEFADQTELAIKWGDGRWPGFDAQFLMGANYVPVCSPHLLTSKTPLLKLSDLGSQPLLHDRDYGDWKRWHQLYPDVAMDPERGHVVSDSNVLAQLAIEGYGVALCVLALIERPLRTGELVVPFPERVMRHPSAYYLLTRKQRPLSSTAQAFIQWLKQEALITEQELNLQPGGEQPL